MTKTLAAVLAILALPCCHERNTPGVPAVDTAPPVGIPCPIVGINDGDSLTVMMDGIPVKVRIEGIDAPEKGQPHSKQSKTALSMLTIQRAVRILATGKVSKAIEALSLEPL